MTVVLNPPAFSIVPRNGILRSRDPDGDGVDESTGNVGTLSLLQPSNVSDTGGFATITVRRTGGSSGAVSCSYATADGTGASGGVDGTDYSSVSGTLNWADGDSADKTFQIPIENRTGKEQGDKTVGIAISDPGGGAALGTAEVTLTIIDSDAATGTIQHLGLSAPDPATQAGTIGWTAVGYMHDPGTGHPMYVTSFGFSHAPPANSSVRGYDFIDDVWRYIQQDRSDGYPFRDPPNLGNLDDVVCNRNNHTAFYFNWCNQIWAGGGFSEKLDEENPDNWEPMNHGIMDITEPNPTKPTDANWKYIWRGDGAYTSDFGVSSANGGSMMKGDPGHDVIKGVVPGDSKVMTAIMPATGTSDVMRCAVRYGGGLYYSPTSFAAYSNEYMLWEQNYDGGPEEWVYTEFFQGDDWTDDMPQIKAALGGGVCAGECFYVYCRHAINSDGARDREFWRLHIPTRTWKQLAKCPVKLGFGHLVYVSRTNQIVLLGGGDFSIGGTDDPDAATNSLLIYDIATDQWTDYTPESPIRYMHLPLCAYCPETDVIAYGDGASGRAADGVTVLTASDIAKLDLFRLVDTGKSVDDIEQVDWNSEVGYTPLNSDSKLLNTGAWHPDTGRWYIIGGDWFGNGGSFKREVWSINPKVPGSDWVMESGYCPPTATDPWYRGRTENLVFWHPTQKVFYVAGGIDQNTSDACGFPAEDMVSDYVLTFDPAEPTLPWAIPTQDPRPSSSNFFKYGCFDYLRDELLLVEAGSGGATIHAMNLGTGSWTTAATTSLGQLVTRGDQCRRGRKLYFAEENSQGRHNFVEFDLDSRQFASLGLLPEDPHADDDPGALFGPASLMTYWAKKDVLAWTHVGKLNTIWFYKFDTQQWVTKVLNFTSDVWGNSLFSVDSDGPIVIGGNRAVAWNGTPPYWVIHDLDI